MCRRRLSAAVLVAGLALAGRPGRAQHLDVPAPPAPFPDRAAPGVPPAGVLPPAGPSPAERPGQGALPPAFRLLNPPRTTPAVPALPPPGRRIEAPEVPAARAQSPALTLEKRGPDAARAGQPLVYELVVRNVGAVPASGLRVEDELPAGARLTATSPPALVQGARLSWSLEALGPGQEARYRVELVPGASGDLVSRAAVTLPLAAAVAQTRVTASSLAVRVQAPAGAAVGQNVDVKIRLLSLDGRPQRGVVLVVRLPEGLRHEGGREIQSDPFDVEGDAVKDIDLHLQAARAGRQVLEARAVAQGQQVGAEAALDVAEAAAPAAVRASIVVRKNGPVRPVLGEQCEYRLEVENRGLTDVTEVCLYDRLPDGLEMVAASGGGVFDAAGRAVQWRLGTLPPHEKRAVTLRVQARAVGEQVNQVWATGEPGQEARLTATMQVDSRGQAAAGRKNR